MTVWIEMGGKAVRVELPEGVSAMDGGAMVCSVDGRRLEVDVCGVGAGVLSVVVDGRQIRCVLDGEAVVVDGRRVEFRRHDPRSWQGLRGARLGSEGPQAVKAPMPGRVVRVLVEARQEVEVGEAVVVIEAMKMQNELRSPKAGRVTKVAVRVGDAVAVGQVLAVVA
jgi:biotin carboxyl carrier protein